MQLSLGCVSDAIWVVGKPLLGSTERRVLTTSESPIEMRLRQGGSLYLTATQLFHFERRPGLRSDRKVATDAYIYHVRSGVRRDPANEMFGWHWHPQVRPECHLHVNAHFEGGMKLQGTHLPTARVSFEEVLMFLVSEMGVQHRRDDWHDVLRGNLTKHETYRTWSGARKPVWQ